MRRFWFLSDKVDRLRAEEMLWQLQVVGSAASGESFSSMLDQLSGMIGEIHVFAPQSSTLEISTDDTTPDPEFDRGALARLKFSLATNSVVT